MSNKFKLIKGKKGNIAKTREEKVALYVISIANELRDEGLITGGFPYMTTEGAAFLKSLEDGGFAPEIDEQVEAMAVFSEMYGVDMTSAGSNEAFSIMDGGSQVEH